MKKPAIYLAAATLAIGTGTAGALAASHGGASTTTSTVHSRIVALEARALAAHQTRLVAALHRMDAAMLRADHAQPNSNPSCPPQSQGGRNGITVPPCGIDHNGILPLCPSSSKNGGSPPPCGNGQGNGPGGGGGGGGGAAPCGPADQGGSAATGPVSSQVYNLGLQVSNGGGAPLGDLVQEVACAVSNLTGGQL